MTKQITLSQKTGFLVKNRPKIQVDCLIPAAPVFPATLSNKAADILCVTSLHIKAKWCGEVFKRGGADGNPHFDPTTRRTPARSDRY